ncbi:MULTISPECIES: radical SAM protein [Gordonibacter]|uniref:Radical SAM protein n=1 Tax=Gordonibacter faecis TaxID=3047475 RepID=A0ABT7DK35_9ACTN|nr:MULTISPECIES: radical SAM protein [unclassified Gordonibacter]MDJ1649887.1 radical SAM protein [Gordonibacter sp. KGMB12511]
MHFTGTIWRPPYEANSALLQVTSGCTHNRCRFCSLYDSPFRLSPENEIESDLKELARYSRNVRRVFVTGANPFGVANKRLVPILNLIKEALPSVETIGGFVRIGDLKHKSEADLEELAALGVDNLTIGVESGYDPALAFMDKGHTGADIVEQCSRLDAAGISYSFFYLTGIAGADKGVEAALASAKVFNQVHPILIGILSMTIFPESKLYEDIQEGRFTPAEEIESLREIRELIANLECSAFVSTAHVSDAVQISGSIPRDKDRLVGALDHAISRADESQLQRYRKSIWSL